MDEKELLDNERPLHEVIVGFENMLQKKLKPSSIKVYMAAVNRFFKDGNKVDDPQGYSNFIIDHMINKRSSHYYDIMLKFANYINIEKYKKKLIISSISNLRKKYHDPIKKTKIISKRERMNVINNLNSYKHQIIGVIQEECGVRIGDVLRLKRGSISYRADDEDVVMVISFIGKGDKARTVYIYSEEAKARIQEFIRSKFINKEYYFLDTKNVRNKYDLLNTMKRNYDLYYYDLKQSCEKMSIDPSEFTSHDIRRNYAVEMFDVVDKNVVELQKLMGHQSVDTTIRYLRHTGIETKDYQKKRNEMNKE